MKILSISMRVFATGIRTGFVNRAIIIGPKEKTWRGIQYIVAIAIHVQVFSDEVAGLYPQVFSQAFDIDHPENWTCCTAAVRAGETIHLLKNFFVGILRQRIEVPGRLLAELIQKLLEFRLFGFGSFDMLL